MSLLTLSLIALTSLAEDPGSATLSLPAPQDEESETAAAEEAPEPPKWTGAVTFGASVSNGNTDIRKSSLTADAIKKYEKSRYTLGFVWSFSEEDDVISQRRVYGAGQFDRFISDRMYWLAQLSGESDKNADLDLRTTVGGGLGYQFLENEKWTLSAEAGLSYLDESFKVGEDEDYVALRAAYKMEWTPNSAWTVGQAIQVFPSLDESEDVNAKADTRVKYALSGNLFAQLQWVYDWDNTPSAGKERVDNLYLLTIGWTF